VAQHLALKVLRTSFADLVTKGAESVATVRKLEVLVGEMIRTEILLVEL